MRLDNVVQGLFYGLNRNAAHLGTAKVLGPDHDQFVGHGLKFVRPGNAIQDYHRHAADCEHMPGTGIIGYRGP